MIRIIGKSQLIDGKFLSIYRLTKSIGQGRSNFDMVECQPTLALGCIHQDKLTSAGRQIVAIPETVSIWRPLGIDMLLEDFISNLIPQSHCTLIIRFGTLPEKLGQTIGVEDNKRAAKAEYIV